MSFGFKSLTHSVGNVRDTPMQRVSLMPKLGIEVPRPISDTRSPHSTSFGFGLLSCRLPLRAPGSPKTNLEAAGPLWNFLSAVFETRSPSSALLPFFGWEGSPAKIDHRKKEVGYQLLLTPLYWFGPRKLPFSIDMEAAGPRKP